MADGVDLQKMASEGLQKAGGGLLSGLFGGVMSFLGALVEPILWIGGLALAAFGLDKWLNGGKLFKPVLEKMGLGGDGKNEHGGVVGEKPLVRTPEASPKPAENEKPKPKTPEEEKAAKEAENKRLAEEKAKQEADAAKRLADEKAKKEADAAIEREKLLLRSHGGQSCEIDAANHIQLQSSTGKKIYTELGTDEPVCRSERDQKKAFNAYEAAQAKLKEKAAAAGR